jgi:hypothetical protein
MPYQLANSDLHTAFSELSIKELHRLKQDPRVDEGIPCGNLTWDPMSIFAMGAHIGRSTNHWIVCHARSRIYAIKAKSSRKATQIVRAYKTIVGKYRIQSIHKRRNRYSPTDLVRDPADPGMPESHTRHSAHRARP